ncbi:MAG: hypothetical protein NC453_14745 [Muribaculum sp.]|nr:hypothetical protein [Muribaculum sp.]
MRKYVFILIVLAVIVIGSLILFNRPQFIANPEYMSNFFNLPSETDKSFIVLDAVYSQGKNGAIGMGTDNYWLRIVDNPHDIGQAILDAGGYETDSIYFIYIIRGDIEGTFTVHKYDDKGHLRFRKIEL